MWKSKEIELYAKAAYEWQYGSREKAYKEASKASYSMIFNEDADEYVMRQKIRECSNEESWKDYVIDVLIDMPDAEIGIAEWVKKFSSVFCAVCETHDYKISPEKDIKDIFKIKLRDKNSPDFKEIPLRKFFEKRIEDKYTRSSIHGVKGESYDAVLV